MFEVKSSDVFQCFKCGKSTSYSEDETWIDDSGFGYSTKLVRCKHCNTIHIIKYFLDDKNERNMK